MTNVFLSIRVRVLTILVGYEHLRDQEEIETTHWDGSAEGAGALVLGREQIEGLQEGHDKHPDGGRPH
jgi:hypothetical protein